MEYGVDEKRIPFEEIGDNDCLLVCEESVVTFTIEYGDQDIATIDWSTEGGVINSIINNGETALIAWPAITNTGSVSIDVTLQNGLVHSTTMCIAVKSKPQGGFEILGEQSSYFCSDTELHFNNLAQAADGLQIIAAIWDFGDGTTSSEFNPTYSYVIPGTYQVMLTVYDECNCSNTWKTTINIEKPGLSISCPTVVCENDLVTYTIEAPAYTNEEWECASYDWIIQGGELMDQGPDWIDVVWNNVLEDGFGYVYFDQGNCNLGCDNYLVAKVPVIAENGTIEGGKTVLCREEQSRYALPKWPTTSIQWKVVDADNASIVMNNATVLVDQLNEIVVDAEFLPPGHYILKANYQNTLLGCGGKAEFAFSVKDILEINEGTSDTEICEGNIADFYLNQTIWGVVWTFSQDGQVIGTAYGSGNNSHATYQFTQPGHYTVMAEANGYCTAYSHIKVIEVPDITGAFITGAEEVCPGVGEEYTFNGDANGFEIKWSVDYGTFLGPDVGPSVMIKFAPGNSDYVVSAQLVNPDFADCASDEITFDVTRFEPEAEIVQTTGDPEAICASSIESFELDGYPGMEYYEWKITPAELGNVADGQGTENADILFNEPFMGQTQGTISVSAKVCGVMQVIDQVSFELMPTPGFAITNAPLSTCPNSSINIEVTMTGGPIISETSLSIEFEGINTTLPGATETTQGVFEFQNIELPNVNPSDQVNISYTITADDPLLCSPVEVTGSIILLPAPEIQIWLSDGGQVFCTELEINTELTANIQGSGVGINDINWVYMGNVVGSGATYLPTLFGTYTAQATNSDNCTSFSNSISIIEDCSPGPFPPCDNETVTITGEWTACDLIELTAEYSGNPSTVSFIRVGEFTGLNALGLPATNTNNILTQEFEVKSSGTYSFVFQAEYSNCVLNSQPEWVDVEYQAIMYLEVSCDENAYDVTILNESTYMPGSVTDIDYSFIKEPAQVISPYQQDDDKATATLGNGDYILGLTLTSTGKPTCEVSENISLQLPDAMFEFDANPVCAENTVNLQPDNPTPDASYLWEFQLASNTLQQISPNLGGTNEIGSEIILTVTDKYGCTDTHSETIVVNKAEYDISLTAEPGTDICEDGEVDLEYDLQSGSATPFGFQWHHNFDQIPGAINSTLLDVNEPGEYSLHLFDSNGCVDLTASSIFINQILSPHLSAKITVSACEGEDIVLTGTLSPASSEYQISRKKNNGSYIEVQPWTNGPDIDFTDTDPGVGNYTYLVEFIDLQTYCVGEEIFNAIVHPTPEVEIGVAHVECATFNQPYAINLKALANLSGGTYTWSNGMSGESIWVDHGGAYQVRFQPDGAACYATATIEAPKSPEEFIWIFPTGCFEYCDEMLNKPYIIGPIGPTPPNYGGYSYDLDGISQAGSNYYPIPSLFVPPMEGALNFTLWNRWDCEATTDNLNLNMEECRDCEIEMVIIKDIIEIRDEEEGDYYQIVGGGIINPFNFPVSVVLTSPQGVFNPSVFIVQANGTYDFAFNPVDFIPYTTGVQNIEIQLQVYGNDGNGSTLLCSDIFEIKIDDYIYYKYGDPQMITMSVVPNPVQNHVEVHYEIKNVDDFDGGVLKMYSLTGSLIKTEKVNAAQGYKIFDVAGLASGAYIIVFLHQGQRIGQQILIKE